MKKLYHSTTRKVPPGISESADHSWENNQWRTWATKSDRYLTGKKESPQEAIATPVKEHLWQSSSFGYPTSPNSHGAQWPVGRGQRADVPKQERQLYHIFPLPNLWITVIVHTVYSLYMGLPRGLSWQESAGQCRRWKKHGFDLWVRKIPWSRKWQPTPVFLPGESHGQRSLAGYSPWGCKSRTQLNNFHYYYYYYSYFGPKGR